MRRSSICVMPTSPSKATDQVPQISQQKMLVQQDSCASTSTWTRLLPTTCSALGPTQVSPLWQSISRMLRTWWWASTITVCITESLSATSILRQQVISTRHAPLRFVSSVHCSSILLWMHSETFLLPSRLLLRSLCSTARHRCMNGSRMSCSRLSRSSWTQKPEHRATPTMAALTRLLHGCCSHASIWTLRFTPEQLSGQRPLNMQTKSSSLTITSTPQSRTDILHTSSSSWATTVRMARL